jgi:hypothetical protein
MNEMELIGDALETLNDANLEDIYISLITNMKEDFIIKLKTLCLWYDSGKYMSKER